MFERALFYLALSLVAIPNVEAQRLFNIDFGAHANPFFSVKTGKAAVGLSDADFWNLYSRDGANGEYLSFSQLLNLKLSDGIATDADLYVSGAPGAWYTFNPDPMFETYLYPGNPNINITLTNLPPAIFDVYVYAHGQPAAENSIVRISSPLLFQGEKATSTAANWDSFGWVEGNQFVLFTNVHVGASGSLSVTIKPGAAGLAVINGIQLFEVLPGPTNSGITIEQQPRDISVPVGGGGTISVTAKSDLPLAYQWFFNGTLLSNATSSSLSVSNVSDANAGIYHVVISNSERNVSSAAASIQVYTPVLQPLLNIDFGAHLNPFLHSKIGPAAVGKSNDDLWNLYSRDGENGVFLDNNTLTNIVWSDGEPSAIRLDVSNAAGAWNTLHRDPMFESYLYPLGREGQINAVFTHVPSGNYDVYVYAHGQIPSENAVVQLTTDSANFGLKVTSSAPDWNSHAWTEGNHYLLFKNVFISNGERLTVSSKPGQSGLAVLNGIQLVHRSTNPAPSITITRQPADLVVPHGSTGDFSVLATNDVPLKYQWFFNNSPIARGTNALLRVENVSSNDVGTYHVEISAGANSVQSSTARLQVFTPIDDPLLNIDYGAHLNPYLRTKSGPAAVGKNLTDQWNLYSRDGTNGVFLSSNRLSNLVWSDGQPSSISISVTNAAGAWYTLDPDPMFESYLYPLGRSGNIGSTLSNLSAGTYDIYVYAHGQIPGENGVIQVTTPNNNFGIRSTSHSPGWDVPSWTEGSHFVLFRNVILQDSEPLHILAKPGISGLAVINGVQIVKKSLSTDTGISIQQQPQEGTFPTGSTVELSVMATSALPLQYQWYLNENPISGAHSSVLRIENAQHPNAGRYYVVVSNTQNSISSRVALLDIYSEIDVPLLNIDFGAHQNPGFTTNIGPAAFGRNLDDRWNLYSRDDGNFGWRNDGVLTELVWSDGTNSNIRLDVSNAAGAWHTVHSDPMFESYLYPLSRVGNIVSIVSNLPSGKYDLIVYAHGRIPSENAAVKVETQSTDYGTKTNSAAANWDPGYWADGGQFLVFANVSIAGGESLKITSYPGESGLAVINGLQLILHEGTRPQDPGAVAPFIIKQPEPRSAHVGGAALFSVSAGGSAPLSYQWKLNDIDIPGANQSVIILSNVTAFYEGEYSVRISNPIGETNSAPAALTVVPLQFERTIALGDSEVVQEGESVSLPILISSSGDIGALSFVLHYDTNYLAEPELKWKKYHDGEFTQVNNDTPGVIHATYVLPGRSFREGDEMELASVTFRTRSVPETLTTPVTLVLNGIYSDAGDPINSGTEVRSNEIQITRRKFIGDNNANDRLDVGDATAIIRMLTLLDPLRAWDVTGNDLNENSSLDAGDIVRVLRVVVRRDPQPGEEPGLLAARQLIEVTPSTSLTSDRSRIISGAQVRVQVNFALPGSVSLSGASFRLDYPTNALRLESSAAHLTGPLVPQNAIAMWNLSPGSDYAHQSGTIHFGASTAIPWSASSGTVGELIFTVLDGAASKYAWPIRLVSAEAGSGIDVIPLTSAQLILTGRDAEPAQLADIRLNAAGNAFELRLVGEAGVRYRIETSTDLVEWTELQSTSDVSGVIQVSDPVDPLASRKFYRAIQLD